MVGQRILIPSVLVRVQVAQPVKKPPFSGGIFNDWGPRTRTNVWRTRMRLYPSERRRRRSQAIARDEMCEAISQSR